MIKNYNMQAYLTLSNNNRLFGKITSVVKKDEVIYKFLFNNSNDYICIKKTDDKWVFVSGMKNPNELWTAEIGLQIDQYEFNELARQA